VREERTRDGPAANIPAVASKKTYKSAGAQGDSQLEVQTRNELGAASDIYARTMILVDTNVLIDAREQGSPYRQWAEEVIATGLSTDGIALNAIVFAELCVGQKNPNAVEADLRARGLLIIDVPLAAAGLCARAYTHYLVARRKSGGGKAPTVPLPDFFIGAHAELLGWKLATRDVERYRTYFPAVELIEPA
jgi:predicted nucleic acid-binding protein